MKDKKRTLTLIVFLLGIFMGAIDSGIVSPARAVIENSFGVSGSMGVWMITIYTLVYAVSMPIVSKLSDRYGRKKVYLLSIILFAVGSALCGISNYFGVNNWGWIFFINLPITLIILILSSNMDENLGDREGKLDLAGSVVISIMILSLMYSLTNLDFFHFSDSIKDINVYPYSIAFFISLPIFIIVENKASDPILNLMINFIVEASKNLQTNVMAVIPQPKIPNLIKLSLE